MPTEVVLAEGRVKVFRNGILIRAGKNLLVNAGYGLICALVGSSGTQPSHMAIGSSGTIATVTQTALIGTQHERVAVSKTVSTRILTIEATFGSGVTGTKSVRELAIFNNASGGTMLSRFTCEEFTIDSSDVVNVLWEVVFGGPVA